MTYPKIFSLSTVGILKHYVHDYLFHPLRTDFIGANGVGKSIIADLLQLMFVYDTSLIKFGTDGVKTDERSIYKLPYNLSLAYAFLNLEVENEKYLTIGIAISSQISSRITPFVISKNVDLSGDISSLALSPEQRIFARDIIADNKVPDTKELAEALLTKHGLYINFFRTKEDTRRYYQFLYDKQILSINLSSDEHLSAFAKVIQSFSKAKSLDLSPTKASKSLKKFLFDDAENDFQGDYQAQQKELERLLRDFSNLDNYVKQLRLKQAGLSKLKIQNDKQEGAFKELSIGRIRNAQNSILSKKEEGTILQEKIGAERERERALDEILKDLPEKKVVLKNEVDKSHQYSELHKTFTSLVQRKEELERDIVEFHVINPPALSSSWYDIEIEDCLPEIDVTALKQLIREYGFYLSSYYSPQALDNAFEKQQNALAELSQKLEQEFKNISTVIDILKGSKQDSVIGWAVMQDKTFSKAEEAVILHFATRAIHPPDKAIHGDTYIDVPDIMDSIEFTQNNDGCWIHSGAFHQYFSITDNALSSVKGDNVSFSEVRGHFEGKKKLIEKQLAAIKSLYKGLRESDASLNGFDPFLVSYTNVKKVKEAAYYIANMDKQLADLHDNLISTAGSIEVVRGEMPSEIRFEEPEMIQRELRRISDARLLEYTNCCTELEMAGKDKENAANAAKRYTDSLIKSTEELLAEQSMLAGLQKSHFDIYKVVLETQSMAEPNVEIDNLSNQFQDALRDYRVTFLELVKQFDETRNEKHPAINKEINEKTFDFSVLESVLLVKVKHTDEIAQELEEANRNRMNMADNIKNSMVRIFDRTVQTYKRYKDLVYTLNGFFQGVKISDRFFFSVNFSKNETVRIDILEEIGTQVRNAARKGELPFDRPVTEFIQEFFRRASQLKNAITIDKLLDPQTFFELSVSLTDEHGVEIPGSTGETYSAIALLGVARLSLVQKDKRPGLRFIILEELGSLDNVNFKTFPAIAKEYNYQIITMAPTPFRSDLDDEWYAHHLLKGVEDKNINYHPSASYFKTKDGSQKLEDYIKLIQRELDRD